MMELQAQLDGVTSTRLGAPLFADKWPNMKVARVACMLGQGHTAQAIADALGDGLTAAQVTAMTSHWGLTIKSARHTYAPVTVEMAGNHRTLLAREAMARGIPMPALAGKLLATVVSDGLFAALLDH